MITKEKRKELDKLLAWVWDIEEASARVLEWFNTLLDEMILVIDWEFIRNQSENLQKVWKELEDILKQIRWEKPTKKTFLSTIFSTGKKLWLLTFEWTIERKVQEIMQAYKDSYKQLCTAVEVQRKKGSDIIKTVEEFKIVEEYLKEKIVVLPSETFDEKILLSSANSFLNNMSKMIVHLEQKMKVLEGSVINSISLKSEMAAGMTHFESLMKDILISASIDNVVKIGANIMETFRTLIEKYWEYSVRDTIETAEAVNNIRKNWAISVDSLKNVDWLLRIAENTYKSLSVKQMADSKASVKELGNIRNQTSKFGWAQEDYLMSNVLTYKDTHEWEIETPAWGNQRWWRDSSVSVESSD